MTYLSVPPFDKMLLFLVFLENLAADFALGRVPKACDGMGDCLALWDDLLAVWTLDVSLRLFILGSQLAGSVIYACFHV